MSESSTVADRFFVPSCPHSGQVTLPHDEAKHLVRVARKQVGDVVEIFDGIGWGASAKVLSTAKDAAILEVGEPSPVRDPQIDLTLAVSVPKGDRFDWLIEKATEIGVTRILPLRCERSVVDPRSAKLIRLRRVIVEASKQCGRNRLMRLEEPRSLGDLLRNPGMSTRLIAHAGGLEPPRWPATGAHAKVALAIGPEGGWTSQEIETAVSEGWTLVGLGPTRLRVETAAIVGASLALLTTAN